MSDLIPVPRQDLEAIVKWAEGFTNSTQDVGATRRLRQSLIDLTGPGYWLTGEDVETLRKWRNDGGYPISGTDGVQVLPPTAVIDAILAACPEPQRFSDEECLAFYRAEHPNGAAVPDHQATRIGCESLTNLAAAGLIVTEAPK